MGMGGGGQKWRRSDLRSVHDVLLTTAIIYVLALLLGGMFVACGCAGRGGGLAWLGAGGIVVMWAGVDRTQHGHVAAYGFEVTVGGRAHAYACVNVCMCMCMCGACAAHCSARQALRTGCRTKQ